MKHSKTTLKLQNKLSTTIEQLKISAKEELTGFVDIDFTVKFDNFPNSLLVHCYFNNESNLTKAKGSEVQYQKALHKQLLKKGIVLKNSKYNLAFILEVK